MANIARPLKVAVIKGPYKTTVPNYSLQRTLPGLATPPTQKNLQPALSGQLNENRPQGFAGGPNQYWTGITGRSPYQGAPLPLRAAR